MAQKPTYEELEQRVEALAGENASLSKEQEKAVNITDRNLAEKALEESEKRYTRILQTATDGFMLIDLDGRILDVNDAYCTMIGYTKEELLKLDVSKIHPKKDLPYVIDQFTFPPSSDDSVRRESDDINMPIIKNSTKSIIGTFPQEMKALTFF